MGNDIKPITDAYTMNKFPSKKLQEYITHADMYRYTTTRDGYEKFLEKLDYHQQHIEPILKKLILKKLGKQHRDTQKKMQELIDISRNECWVEVSWAYAQNANNAVLKERVQNIKIKNQEKMNSLHVYIAE